MSHTTKFQWCVGLLLAFGMATASTQTNKPASAAAKPAAEQPAKTPAQELAEKESGAKGVARRQRLTSPEARALLDKAKAKLKQVKTMAVEIDSGYEPSRFFTLSGEMFLERPNRFRVESIT